MGSTSIEADRDETSSPDSVLSSSSEAPREAVPVRRFISDTVIFGLVDTIDRAIGFILLPITTALMVPSEYGVLSLFQTTTEILQYVIALGVFNAFFRFYLQVNDPDAKRQILNASFWQISSIAMLASLVMLPFASFWNESIFESRGLLFPIMTVPTTYMAVLISLGDCRLQADGRAWSFLGINVLQTITMRGLSLALLIAGWGAAGWIIGQFAGQCVTVTAFIFIAFSGISFSLDKTWSNKLFRFGVILVPLAISQWAMQGTAKYLMRALLEDPLHQIGLYTVGERISQIMAMMNLAFALGWRRFAFSNMHHPDGPRLLGHGATLFFAISGLGAVGLISLGDDLTRWMIRPDYWLGIQVIPYLTIAGFCWGVTEVLAISLYKADRPQWLSATYVTAAILCVVLNFILIPRFGMNGAAYAWMIAEIVKMLLVWGIGQWKAPIDIQYGRVAMAAAVYIPITVACMQFFPETTVGSTLAQMGIVACAPLLLWMLGFLTPSEREMIGDGIHQGLSVARRYLHRR